MSRIHQSDPGASHVAAAAASVASRAQERANRRNAKRSTGPRTAEGKRRAAQNAISHGVFCKDAVLPGERRGEFAAFRNLLLNAPGMRPQDWLELSIAEQYVMAKWRMRRAQGGEALLHGSLAQEMAETIVQEAKDDGLLSHDEDEDEDDDDTYEDERPAEVIALSLHARRRRAGVAAQHVAFLDMVEQGRLPATVTLAMSIGQPDGGGFERIGRYLHRLEVCADRALRELRQSRKDRGVDVSNLPKCPFLEPVVDEADEPDPWAPPEAAQPPAPEEPMSDEVLQRLIESMAVIDDMLTIAKHRHGFDPSEDADDDDDDDGDEGDDAADGGDGHAAAADAPVDKLADALPGALSDAPSNAPSKAPSGAPADAPDRAHGEARTALVKNEPNSAETTAGAAPAGGCEEASRKIKAVTTAQIARWAREAAAAVGRRPIEPG